MTKLHLRSFVFGALLSVSLAAGVFAGLSVAPNRQARSGFEARAEAMTKVVAYLARPGLELEDRDAMLRDLAVARLETQVVYAAIRTVDGTLVAGVNADQQPDVPELRGPLMVSRKVGGVYVVAVPMQTRKAGTHWLFLGMSLEALQSTRC